MNGTKKGAQLHPLSFGGAYNTLPSLPLYTHLSFLLQLLDPTPPSSPFIMDTIDMNANVDTWDTLELTSSDPCRTTIVYKIPTHQSPTSSPSSYVSPLPFSFSPPVEKIIYTAHTDERRGSRPITTFSDRVQRVVGELEWHLRMSDRISVHGREMKNVGKWLVKSGKWGTGRSSSVYTFKSTRGTEYQWKKKGNDPSGALELFVSDNSSVPIARFNPRASTATISPNARPASSSNTSSNTPSPTSPATQYIARPSPTSSTFSVSSASTVYCPYYSNGGIRGNGDGDDGDDEFCMSYTSYTSDSELTLNSANIASHSPNPNPNSNTNLSPTITTVKRANIQVSPQAKKDLDEIVISILLIEKARKFDRSGSLGFGIGGFGVLGSTGVGAFLGV